MPQTKEEKAIYNKMYKKTPAGIKAGRKGSWKHHGIIIKNFDEFYEKFLSTSHCEICQKELTVDKKMTHSTKCVDHDHNINDRENVRYICCNACNSNDKSTNTSGIPNIYYTKRDNRWRFRKTIKGTTYRSPYFKTKEEAIDYKTYFVVDNVKTTALCPPSPV